MQSNRSRTRWNGIQLTLVSSTCMTWRFLIVCVHRCVWDEQVVWTPGICSVMKHSRGVARGVYSTQGCKMKLCRSNLHSRRTITFITPEARCIKVWILFKINDISSFFSSGRVLTVICMVYVFLLPAQNASRKHFEIFFLTSLYIKKCRACTICSVPTY